MWVSAGAGFGGGAGGGAGVAEKVEDVDGAAGGAGGFDLGGEPLPVDGLLGEEAGVFEGRGGESRCQADVVGELPVVGEGICGIPICRRLVRCGGKSRPSRPIWRPERRRGGAR